VQQIEHVSGMKTLLLATLLLLTVVVCAEESVNPEVQKWEEAQAASHARAMVQFSALIKDDKSGFLQRCDDEIAAAQKNNDPIVTQPDWPEKIGQRVFDKFFKGTGTGLNSTVAAFDDEFMEQIRKASRDKAFAKWELEQRQERERVQAVIYQKAREAFQIEHPPAEQELLAKKAGEEKYAALMEEQKQLQKKNKEEADKLFGKTEPVSYTALAKTEEQVNAEFEAMMRAVKEKHDQEFDREERAIAFESRLKQSEAEAAHKQADRASAYQREQIAIQRETLELLRQQEEYRQRQQSQIQLYIPAWSNGGTTLYLPISP